MGYAVTFFSLPPFWTVWTDEYDCSLYFGGLAGFGSAVHGKGVARYSQNLIWPHGIVFSFSFPLSLSISRFLALFLIGRREGKKSRNVYMGNSLICIRVFSLHSIYIVVVYIYDSYSRYSVGNFWQFHAVRKREADHQDWLWFITLAL
jgi:hypothetical protein